MTDTKKIDYIGIMDSLKTKQMILQGPPGTSKTYGAKEIIAAALAPAGEELQTKEKINTYLRTNLINGENVPNGRWDMVQFHPSYGYEDFVRGITVETNAEKGIEYNTLNRIFGQICAIAKGKEESYLEAIRERNIEKQKKNSFFLLIDEINRADVATVFGELIYALENRGEEVTTPYAVKNGNGKSYKIYVPENLYVIGTMNTADKSVGNIDYAIRRRFLFFDRLPDKKIICEYRGVEENEEDKVVKVYEAINELISKCLDKNYSAKDFKIGHTYFLIEKDENEVETLNRKMQYQVLPILREYVTDGILKVKGVDLHKSLSAYLLEGYSLENPYKDDTAGITGDESLLTRIIKDLQEL